LLYELPRETQVRVLREALRVVERVIVIDLTTLLNEVQRCRFKG
jgi:hypothetical protein